LQQKQNLLELIVHVLQNIIPATSGAGTILGQGGKDREGQSRERKIKFFAGIGAFFCRIRRVFFVPKASVLQKEKKRKRSSPD